MFLFGLTHLFQHVAGCRRQISQAVIEGVEAETTGTTGTAGSLLGPYGECGERQQSVENRVKCCVRVSARRCLIVSLSCVKCISVHLLRHLQCPHHSPQSCTRNVQVPEGIYDSSRSSGASHTEQSDSHRPGL